MANHMVYRNMVRAMKLGTLPEPFNRADMRQACPGLAEGTYKAFPDKHKVGNGKTSELFIKVGEGKFIFVKPLKYGLGNHQDA